MTTITITIPRAAALALLTRCYQALQHVPVTEDAILDRTLVEALAIAGITLEPAPPDEPVTIPDWMPSPPA